MRSEMNITGKSLFFINLECCRTTVKRRIKEWSCLMRGQGNWTVLTTPVYIFAHLGHFLNIDPLNVPLA